MNVDPSRTANPDRLLATCIGTLLALIAVNVVLVAGLMASGRTLSESLHRTEFRTLKQLAGPAYIDSWAAMSIAYQEHASGQDMYERTLNGSVNYNKFQYPPASLLLFAAIPSGEEIGALGVESGTTFNAVVSWISRLAVLATVAASAALMLLVTERSHQVVLTRRRSIMLAAAISALALGFYPLLYAHQLGQVQVFLNLFMVLALLAIYLRASIIAGVLIGLCATFKPQYAVVLAWALLLRDWRFAIAMAATSAIGLAHSIAVFGLEVHLRYIDVLRVLAAHGEAYWPNQSMNGLTNRLLWNGDPVHFGLFPPLNPVVRAATTLSSIAILAGALVPALWMRNSLTGANPLRTTYSFAAVLAGLTLASPIAWEHHYGFFVALFALLLPATTLGTSSRIWPVLLAMAYLAMASICKIPEVFFTGRLLGLVASHLYFGAIVVLVLVTVAGRLFIASANRHSG